MREPDPILLALAQQGEREALDRLLQLSQGSLHRYLAALLRDPAAADDVLQETLFRIARKLKWLSDPKVYRAWAFRIASREAHRHLRRRGFTVPIDDAPGAVASEPVAPVIDLQRLQGAVDALSPASRAVVTLHYLSELPLHEIAAVLEIPLGTVKSRLAYGLRQLRERMG